MKTNLFIVTIKKHNNATETFYVKGYNISDVIDKTNTYINSIGTPGVADATIEEARLVGKILI